MKLNVHNLIKVLCFVFLVLHFVISFTWLCKVYFYWKCLNRRGRRFNNTPVTNKKTGRLKVNNYTSRSYGEKLNQVFGKTFVTDTDIKCSLVLQQYDCQPTGWNTNDKNNKRHWWQTGYGEKKGLNKNITENKRPRTGIDTNLQEEESFQSCFSSKLRDIGSFWTVLNPRKPLVQF